MQIPCRAPQGGEGEGEGEGEGAEISVPLAAEVGGPREGGVGDEEGGGEEGELGVEEEEVSSIWNQSLMVYLLYD